MKEKNVKKLLSIVLSVVMMMSILTGCGGGNGDSNVAGGEQVTVKLLVNYDLKDEMESVIPVFEKSHPNIKVELVDTEQGIKYTPTALSKLAAAGELPDVAFGAENFAYIMSQGLAYPLDKLYENDPDKDNMLQAAVQNYTYGGHLYALPFRVQFNTILVNEDLFDVKNLDKPDYDWTIEEFINLAKGATDSQYSGINVVDESDATHTLEAKLFGGMLEAPYQMYGYNLETHQFDFTSGAWAKAKNYVNELRSVPGLIADELKEPSKRSEGIADAYDNKFGGSADALASGKVLFGNHNSWSTYWMNDSFNFEWDLYPTPTAEGVEQRIQTHIDYVCMLSSVTEEKREAAYELLKFLSYDEEGCIARMDWYINNTTGKYTSLYTPGSANEKVLEHYDSLDVVPDGMKWMLKEISENPEKIFIADANKIIPNFWNDVEQYMTQVEEQIKNGGDPNALAADFQNKVNAAATTTWTNFEKKVNDFAAEFYETHSYEK